MFIKIHNSVIKGDYPFRLAASRQATFPKGTALVVAGNFAAAPKGVPLGELAATKGSRLRGLLGLTASTPSVIACGDATFPKGTALAAAVKFPAVPKGVPLGELAANAVSRLRGFLIIIYPPIFSHSRSFNPHSRRISFVFAQFVVYLW